MKKREKVLMVPSTDKIYNVTMYTIDNCEFCERAKNLLHYRQNYVIHEVNLTREAHLRDNIREKLGTTAPQIVIEGIHIGGYQELQEYFDR